MMVKLPSFDTLTKRNVALRAVRRYFDEMGYCEVQTRAMRATTATDPYIESFKTFGVDEDLPLYLQTSPEYATRCDHRHYFYRRMHHKACNNKSD